MKGAAEECDGVMLHAFYTRKYLDDVVVPRLRKGLGSVRKGWLDFEVSGGGFVATGKDNDIVSNVFVDTNAYRFQGVNALLLAIF